MSSFVKDEEPKRGKSALQNIPLYKNEIITRMLENEKLMKLVAYDRADCLKMPVLEDSSELMYDRIFPYRFVPEPTQSQKTYLTIGMSGFRRAQEGFKIYDDFNSGDIYIYLFTHVDIMKTNSGVRQDLILGEIDKMFNGVGGIGFGQLKLRYTNEIWFHNNKFGGYSLVYSVTDFK